MTGTSFIDMIKEIVGGFTAKQMIAIGGVVLLAILVGFFIGGALVYGAGIRRGKRRGVEGSFAIARQQAEEDVSGQVEEALREERKKNALLHAKKDSELKKAQAQLKQSELSRQEAQKAALLAERSKTEAQRIAEEAKKSEQEAQKMALAAVRSKEEAEKAAEEAEDKMRALRESEAAGETIIRERKSKIELLSKEEILAYAGGLDEYLPASVYERGGENLPDSCRVGICTFLIVYERKGMVKLILRLHKKTAAALEKQYRLFMKAAYPKGGDWYKWILSSEVKDFDIVAAAIRMAYKYVFLSNYDEKTHEINVTSANRDEMKIGESLLKNKDLPDRDFIVASDAEGGKTLDYRLYGKQGIAAYCRSLATAYPVTVTESENELSPSTVKVAGRTFLMAYEKEGVTKIIFRMSEQAFALLKRKHPTADVSPFPKAVGYHWYVAQIDQTFASDADIEEIVRSSCAHVYDSYK